MVPKDDLRIETCRSIKCQQGDAVNNTTRSFLIDVIIRNQDIKKLETACFGLTLAIFRFHLEKLFVRFVIQLCKRALVLSTHQSRVF